MSEAMPNQGRGKNTHKGTLRSARWAVAFVILSLAVSVLFILPTCLTVTIGGLTDLNKYASTIGTVGNGSVAHFPPGTTVFPAGTRFEATGMQANRIDLYVPGTQAEASALAAMHALARDTDQLAWMGGINDQFSLKLNPTVPSALWGTFQGTAGHTVSFLWVDTATGERVYVASTE